MISQVNSASTNPTTFTSLDQTDTGCVYRVVAIQDENCREQILRMGFSEGTQLKCITNIRRGPVVVRCGHTDVAIGRGMAKRIQVTLVNRDVGRSVGGMSSGFMSSGSWFGRK